MPQGLAEARSGEQTCGVAAVDGHLGVVIDLFAESLDGEVDIVLPLLWSHVLTIRGVVEKDLEAFEVVRLKRLTDGSISEGQSLDDVI